MKLPLYFRSVVVLTVGLAALIASSAAIAEPVRLNFGVYSSNKPSAMVRVFKPVLKELEARVAEKLGRRVEIRMQIAKDYDQGISHLTSGKVDFSRFGPASYIEAKKMNTDVEILAMESKASAKVFYGIIATSQNSPIQKIEDLRDNSFAFGDEGSTIGRFLSQLYLVQNRIHADNLSKYEYLGRHDRVGTAVAAGDFAAGALNESTFKKLVEAGEPLREISKFPNVTKPWIARSGLDPVIFEALRLSLLEIRNRDVLKGLKIDGFLRGNDSDYAVIRKAMDFNHLFFEDPEKLNNDETMSTHYVDYIEPAEQIDLEEEPITNRQTNYKNTSNPRQSAASEKANDEKPSVGSALPTAQTPPVADKKPLPITPTNMQQYVDVQTSPKDDTPQDAVISTSKVLTSSNYNLDGDNLTINIALPARLLDGSKNINRAQNVTINLTFPHLNKPVNQVSQ